MTLFRSIILAALALSAHVQASDLVVQNAFAAQSASYSSTELADSLPLWILDGQLIDRAEARNTVFADGKTACTIWLMNFSDSDDADFDKSIIQKAILKKDYRLPLWKKVNGKHIFVDDPTGYAVSYNCVTQGTSGQFEEVESLSDQEFNQMFLGILKIE